MDTMEEHIRNQAAWTVRDSDGIDHRAIQQSAGSITWIITVCRWWKTHNVSGQAASVRTDRVPTCLECTQFEISAVGQPKCAHCGFPSLLHNMHMHAFEAVGSCDGT